MTYSEAANFLGLSLKGLTIEDLRHAYRAAAKEYHSDSNPNVQDSTNFIKATEAYNLLQEYLKYNNSIEYNDSSDDDDILPTIFPNDWFEKSLDRVKDFLNDILTRIKFCNIGIAYQGEINNTQIVSFWITNGAKNKCKFLYTPFLYIIKPGQQKTCIIGDSTRELSDPLLDKLFDICAKKTHYDKANNHYKFPKGLEYLAGIMDFEHSSDWNAFIDKMIIDKLCEMISNPDKYKITRYDTGNDFVGFQQCKVTTIVINNFLTFQNIGHQEYEICKKKIHHLYDKDQYPLLRWFFKVYNEEKYKQDKREMRRQKIARIFGVLFQHKITRINLLQTGRVQ